MSNPSPKQSRRPDSTRRKKRPRPLPHVNARNLAIEKKRREQMNGNFLDLAYLVPSLAHTQRLTKVHIVNKTIEHLSEQRHLCASAARDMQELLVENYRLVAQVNMLRATTQGSAGAPTMTAEQVRPVPETLARLMEVGGSLGEQGTATLRDAHEGPEPRCKWTPPVSSQRDDTRDVQSRIVGLASMDNEIDLAAQHHETTCNIGFDIATASYAQHIQHAWPLPVHIAPAQLEATSTSTAPRDAFGDVILANLPCALDLSPYGGLDTITLGCDNSLWPGIGTC